MQPRESASTPKISFAKKKSVSQLAFPSHGDTVHTIEIPNGRNNNTSTAQPTDAVSAGLVRALADGLARELTLHHTQPPSIASTGGKTVHVNTSTAASSFEPVPQDCFLQQCLENRRFHKEFTNAKCIGVGGMGSVVAAQHREGGGWSAVKLIPFTAHSDARERQQFAEVAALKDLSSRHVVRYEEHWLEEFSQVHNFLPPGAFQGQPVVMRRSPSNKLGMTSRPRTLSKITSTDRLGDVQSSWSEDSSEDEDSCGIDFALDTVDENLAVVPESDNSVNDQKTIHDVP